MLNFGASKPRVKGGAEPPGPPGSAPGQNQDSIAHNFIIGIRNKVKMSITDWG